MQRIHTDSCQSNKLMSRFQSFFLILALSFSILTCSKNNPEQDCQSLKNGITDNNHTVVQSVITQFINRLPSKNYTSQNLTELATSIFEHCTVTVDVLCFDCIKTLPTQSEIKISFNTFGTIISKVIDISYSPDNTMKFVNMHE